MAEPQLISVLHLVAHPELFEGRRVRVVGFCVLVFEGKALYVTEGDHRAANTRHAVWLEVPLSRDNQSRSGTMAIVDATFETTSRGHLGMYVGTLRDVTSLEPWSG